MTREEYIKALIKNQGYTVKGYAASIGMAYTTLLSILNGGLGGAAVDSVIKICSGLGITVDTLEANTKAVPEDKNLQHLINNYNRMNAAGREKLVSYSDDLAANPANTADEPRIKLQIAAEGGLRDEEIPRVTQSAIDESENEMLRLKIRESLGLTPEEYREEYGDEGE